MSKVNKKPKRLPSVVTFEEDRDFINIECAKKKMSQPEMIRAWRKIYEANFKSQKIKKHVAQ